MKIGIIGSGDVGRSIAVGFAGLGNEVKMGSREGTNKKLEGWIAETKTDLITSGTFNEVAKFGELIVIAVKGDSISDALALAGHGNFVGKTVIDVTNPLEFPAGSPPRLSIGFNDSAGETIQRLLKGANVVKTLNIIGNKHMVNPKFDQGEPDMLLCGNDENAKKQVEKILRDFGWKNITDLGSIEQSRVMEPLCILWVTYAMKHNNWNIAFKMLTN